MKVYLIHHAHALTAEQDPARPLSAQGRVESERLVARLKSVGAQPERILHSDKLWTQETAERVAAGLGAPVRPALAGYSIGTDDPLAPFLAEIATASGDIAMAGHVDYLVRSASRLVGGNEKRTVVEFKPGNGTVFCLEGSDDNWVVAWGWRQEQLGA